LTADEALGALEEVRSPWITFEPRQEPVSEHPQILNRWDTTQITLAIQQAKPGDCIDMHATFLAEPHGIMFAIEALAKSLPTPTDKAERVQIRIVLFDYADTEIIRSRFANVKSASGKDPVRTILNEIAMIKQLMKPEITKKVFLRVFVSSAWPSFFYFRFSNRIMFLGFFPCNDFAVGSPQIICRSENDPLWAMGEKHFAQIMKSKKRSVRSINIKSEMEKYPIKTIGAISRRP
jgi:hypothetical protein